jgi:flagellin
MIGSTGSISSAIASVYGANTRMLSDALSKIASGKKFRGASDDLVGFLRAQRLDTDIGGYQSVRENLTAYKMYTSTAVSTASNLYENLTKMKDLSLQYDATADADLRAQYSAEFDALATQVSTAIDETFVDGTAVADTTALAALDPVNLDPDGDGQLTFSFTAGMTVTADVALLDITTAGAGDVQTELDAVLTFMEEVKAYDSIIDQQLTINDTVINSKQALKSLITDIDEAEQMGKVLDLTLRQQASVAMMAQANMLPNSLLKLYE